MRTVVGLRHAYGHGDTLNSHTPSRCGEGRPLHLSRASSGRRLVRVLRAAGFVAVAIIDSDSYAYSIRSHTGASYSGAQCS